MGERTSRVTSRTIRQALEIRSIIEAGSYRTRDGALVEIAEAILRMIDGSQVVDSSTPDMASDAVTLPVRRKVEITQEDSVDAVFRLASTGSRVGLLNFASGLHRGGGFDLGASAQEEALCRASMLIAALESTRADLFYERNAPYQTSPGVSKLLLWIICVSDAHHLAIAADDDLLRFRNDRNRHPKQYERRKATETKGKGVLEECSAHCFFPVTVTVSVAADAARR